MSEAFCDLCGLPLSRGSVEADMGGERLRFCCFGCRQVYALLLESTDSPDPARFRETEIYRRCLEAGIIPASEEDLEGGDGDSRETGPESGDEPSSEEGGDRPLLDLELRIEGMWCPACAWVVEEFLKRDRGVRSADCQFVLDRLRVQYDPVLTSPESIRKQVGRLGYRALMDGEEARDGTSARELVRFGVSGFLTLNVMMLSLALYSGFFTHLGPEAAAKLSWPIVLLAGVVFVYGGAPIHRAAIAGFLNKAPGMEALISIGAASAFLYSLSNWMQGSIHLYFDTACMLITLVLVGKLAERKTREKVLARLGNFYDLLPGKVRMVTEGFPQGRYADAGQLAEGDQFLVAENDVAAADGTVLRGRARVDESTLTGEAEPVGKAPGDVLRSGTSVVEGSLTVQAESVGRDSTVGRLIGVMENALADRAGFEGPAERALRWFVPGILLLALGTAGVCYAWGLGAEEALLRGITVLVISCPCALGVAVPLARVAGISLAGERGILVHDFDAFERIRGLDTAVLDKTGTLTRGDWRLTDIVAQKDWKERQILSIAAGLEAHSGKNVARAVREAARERVIAPEEIGSVTERGNGIEGYWGRAHVALGSMDFVAGSLGSRESGPLGENPARDPALSRVAMAVDGSYCATLLFGDTLRENSPAALAALREHGLEPLLVSGDGPRTTREMGAVLGIEHCLGGMLPADKAGYVRDLKAKGCRVLMAGDGVNDAPALAVADVGVGTGSGGRIGREGPSLTLMGSDLRRIPEFFGLARRVRRTVRTNLVFSFAYNAVAIPVAMSGLLNPLIAVTAMMLSSLSVTGNSLLLVKRGKRPAQAHAPGEAAGFRTGSPQ
ncbi:MAG: cation-translocating P-type ATPase [Desulfohalobiaceae bacterium]